MFKRARIILILCLIVSIVFISFEMVGCKQGITAAATTVAAETTAAGTTAPETTLSEEVKELIKIKIAVPPYQDCALIVVADEKGFFEEEGFDAEIISCPWDATIELAASGAVDFANAGDVDLANKIDTVKNVIFTNLMYLWEANSIGIQKESNYKTFEDFLAEGMSDYDAAKATCAQLKGGAAIVPRNSDKALFLKECAEFGGVNFMKDVEPYIIDMEAPEGLAAFIGGDGDFFLPGIPQMQALKDSGFPIMLHQKNVPLSTAVTHDGEFVQREFAENNFDLLVKFQAVIFKTLNYIDQNPMESFTIIADYLNAVSAAGLTPELIRDNYWNVIETFPLEADTYRWTIKEDGPRYWKTRWEKVFEEAVTLGAIKEVPKNLEDYTIQAKVYDAYMTQYQPELYGTLKQE